MSRLAARAAVVILITLLGACATKYAHTTPSQPPAWRIGYTHGCDSGIAALGHPWYRYTRDQAYAGNPRYREGWQTGFDGGQQQLGWLFGDP